MIKIEIMEVNGKKKLNYLEYFLYRNHASMPNARLGNHAAMIGLKFAFKEKTAANLPTKIYKRQIKKPTAR